jgi:hypothetical protein
VIEGKHDDLCSGAYLGSSDDTGERGRFCIKKEAPKRSTQARRVDFYCCCLTLLAVCCECGGGCCLASTALLSISRADLPLGLRQGAGAGSFCLFKRLCLRVIPKPQPPSRRARQGDMSPCLSNSPPLSPRYPPCSTFRSAAFGYPSWLRPC